MKSQIVEVLQDEPVVSHMKVAEYTLNDARSIKDYIVRYKKDFEEFGVVRFKNAVKKGNSGGTLPKVFLLNEQQAYLLLTYLRNSNVVRAFKVALIKAFFQMRETLYQNNSQEVHELRQNKVHMDAELYKMKMENTELRRSMGRMLFNEGDKKSIPLVEVKKILDELNLNMQSQLRMILQNAQAQFRTSFDTNIVSVM